MSSTFHGRDIFAPVAARLSLGVQMAEFGEVIYSIAILPQIGPHREDVNVLVGHVVHIDGFGNLITDIRSDDLPAEKESLNIEVSGQRIRGLSRTYAEAEGLLALIGSSGCLEVSLNGGSARNLLTAEVGCEVRIILD